MTNSDSGPRRATMKQRLRDLEMTLRAIRERLMVAEQRAERWRS